MKMAHPGRKDPVQWQTRSTCNLLFLSSGKREDTPVKQLTEPQSPGHLLYSLSHSFFRKAVIFRSESKFTGSIYIEELGTGILEHRTHFFRNVKQRQFPRILPFQTDSPRKISFIIVGISPLNRRVRVVFPHPDSPQRRTKEPSSIRQEICCSAPPFSLPARSHPPELSAG